MALLSTVGDINIRCHSCYQRDYILAGQTKYKHGEG